MEGGKKNNNNKKEEEKKNTHVDPAMTPAVPTVDSRARQQRAVSEEKSSGP